MRTPESSAVFDFERMAVYQAAMEFVTIAQQVAKSLPRGHGNLADQIQRAAISIALNIAEGSGEFSPPEKIRFYRVAFRSASECGAALDIASRIAGLPASERERARIVIQRIGAMLLALIHRLQDAPPRT